MNKKGLFFLLSLLAVLILFLKYSDSVLSLLLLLKNILTPLILGCALAYILNIIVYKIESIPVFQKKGTVFSKIKRPFSVLCSIGIVLALLALIIQIVIPQLLDAVSVLAKGIPDAISQILSWLSASGKDWPQFEKYLNSLNVNWPQLLQKAASHLSSGLTSLFTSTVVILSSISSLIMNLVVAFIFSIYILSGKERLFHQFQTVAKTYLKPVYYSRLSLVLSTAHDTFTRFIIGQCTEAVIIGLLCAGGMFLLRFPYSSMVGTLVGATALIPVVGAYLGAFIGAFMIFTVSPLQAVGFLIFITILQQLEGNLIYPRVVGSSVGLPGIWVLAAVTIGGGLWGILGMLVAVPVTATLYKLLQKDIQKRNELSGTRISS